MYQTSGCHEKMRAGRETRQTGDKTPACHLPPLPLVPLHWALGGTDGASSRVPPQCPPFPKLAWALAAYARAQEDLVGEVMTRGGHFSVDAGCPCGEHKAVPRVQELVSALAVWQDPCLEHP